MKNDFEFKEILQDLIIDNNITGITELSERTGIQYKILDNFVKGIYKPSLKNIIILSKFFNCSIDYLMGNSEHKGKSRDCISQNFYQQFCRLLQEKKTTKYKFTKDTNISYNTIKKWKEGAIPTLATLNKLAHYFYVPIDLLIK